MVRVVIHEVGRLGVASNRGAMMGGRTGGRRGEVAGLARESVLAIDSNDFCWFRMRILQSHFSSLSPQEELILKKFLTSWAHFSCLKVESKRDCMVLGYTAEVTKPQLPPILSVPLSTGKEIKKYSIFDIGINIVLFLWACHGEGPGGCDRPDVHGDAIS